MVNAAQGVSSGEIDIAFIKMRSMFTGMVVNTKYSRLYAPPMVLVWTDKVIYLYTRNELATIHLGNLVLALYLSSKLSIVSLYYLLSSLHLNLGLFIFVYRLGKMVIMIS